MKQIRACLQKSPTYDQFLHDRKSKFCWAHESWFRISFYEFVPGSANQVLSLKFTVLNQVTLNVLFTFPIIKSEAKWNRTQLVMLEVKFQQDLISNAMVFTLSQLHE